MYLNLFYYIDIVKFSNAAFTKVHRVIYFCLHIYVEGSCMWMLAVFALSLCVLEQVQFSFGVCTAVVYLRFLIYQLFPRNINVYIVAELEGGDVGR